mgnify:CR=1 FL=1
MYIIIFTKIILNNSSWVYSNVGASIRVSRTTPLAIIATTGTITSVAISPPSGKNFI